MREEAWQLLVVDALTRSLGLSAEDFWREVPTRDGSRIDLLHVRGGRMTGFELKVGEEGEALRALAGRDQRQLRHFGAFCDALYLVTLSSPRRWSLSHDGLVVELEPLERQLLPPGVGWIAFDRLTLEATILEPAPDLRPRDEDRRHVADWLLSRIKRLQREAQRCR